MKTNSLSHEIPGTLNNVLQIDLPSKTFTTVSISKELRKKYLGGKGLGLKLLYDRLAPGIDPLDKENYIIIMTGVMTGTGGPCSGRFHTVFKSPLTNIVGSTSCGGSFGRQLKSNGWDGVVFSGKSDKPVLIQIHNHTVDFVDASDLWGCNIPESMARIGKKNKESLLIGPAGENLVRFANVASGSRYLGRGGLGAVMGSKNLKAVVALKGQYSVVPVHKDRFKKVNKIANQFINRNSVSISNRRYGTASNAKPIIKNNMLPVHNFSFGRHSSANEITGEMIRKKHNTTYYTCKPCSILCGHKGEFNGKVTSVPEYETLALLGANIGIFDPNEISAFNEICNHYGMDTISAGGTLAWVMEAGQKGLVKTDLDFGSSKEIKAALNTIANLEGFGKEMAMGTRALSEKYGGKAFAMQVKGLEMAGYDPRGAYGQGLAYAVANRGACHLSAFLVGFENILGILNPHTARSKPVFVNFLENLNAAVNSMVICQFTEYAFTLETLLTKLTPRFVLRTLMQNVPSFALALIDFSLYPKLFYAASGIKLSSKEFLKAGERIHVLERHMNNKEGIRKQDDTLPQRLLKEFQQDDVKKRKVPLSQMLNKYYKIRGYDKNGMPRKKLLKKLKI